MSRHRQRPPIVAILFLIAFLLGVLYFLGSRQLNNSKAHRLRLLAGFADRVESTVPDLAERFHRIAGQTAHLPPCLELVEEPDAELLGQLNEEPVDTPDSEQGSEQQSPDLAATRDIISPCRQEKVREYVEQIPNLTFVSDQERTVEEEEVLPVAPAIELRPLGQNLYLVHRNRVGKAPSRVFREVRAKLDLNALLAPAVLPNVFESLFVAALVGEPAAKDGERSGVVLFQRGEPELRLTSLKPIFGTVDGAGKTDGDSQTFVRGQDLETSMVDFPEDPATGSIPVRVAEIEYRLFLQPIVLELPHLRQERSPRPVRWVAGGFVSRDRLLSASLTTSPVLLGLLLSIFPLAIVAWPFLKLWLVSPRQRIQRSDAAFLVLSMFLGCVLITLVTLTLDFMARNRIEVDRQLRELAGAVEQGFLTELKAAHRQLEALDGESVRRRIGQEARRVQDQAKREQAQGGTRFGALPEGAYASLPGDLAAWQIPVEDHPVFHSVFWADGNGDQRLKLALRAHSKRYSNVGDRAYFECASGRREPFLIDFSPGDPGTEPVALCLESVISNTGGADQTILALPPSRPPAPLELDAKNEREPPACVLGECHPVMATRFASLTEPWLPSSYGFAIVDVSEPDRAQVLFHADTRRILSEDLLKASDEDSVLAAMLVTRREGPLTIRYWGQRYRAYVTPLNGLPWALVTFRNLRDVRLRTIELVYDLFNPFLVYMVAVLTVFGLLMGLVGRRFRGALWPDPKKNGAYLAIVLFVMASTALYALLLAREQRRFPNWSSELAIATLVIPTSLIGLSIGMLVWVHRREYLNPQWDIRWSTAFQRWLRGLRPIQAARWLWQKVVAWEKTLRKDYEKYGELRRYGLLRSVAYALTPIFIGLATAAVILSGYSLSTLLLSGAVLVMGLSLFWLRGYFHGYQRRRSYTFSMTCLLFGATVLPAVGLYVLAEERQQTFIIQDVQEGIAASREQALGATLGSLGPERPFFERYEDVLTGIWHRQVASLYGTIELKCGEQFSVSCDEPPAARWPWRGQTATIFSARPLPVNELSSDVGGVDLSRYATAKGEWWIDDSPPNETDGTGEVRPEPALWGVVPSAFGTGNDQLWWSRLPRDGFLDRLWDPEEDRFRLSELFKVRSLLGVLLFAIAVGFPWGLMYTVAHRLLFVSLAGVDPGQEDEEGKDGSPAVPDLGDLKELLSAAHLTTENERKALVILGVPKLALQAFQSSEQYCLVPWGGIEPDELEKLIWGEKKKESDKTDGKGTKKGEGAKDDRPVVILGLWPEVGEPKKELERLRLLERLLQEQGRSVVILSQLDPRWLVKDAEPGDDVLGAAVRRQWIGLLGTFTFWYSVDRGDADFLKKMQEKLGTVLERLHWVRLTTEGKGESKREWRGRLDGTFQAFNTLYAECRPTRRLQQIALELMEGIRPDSYEAFTDQKLVGKIALAARSYYQALWSSTSEQEKVVLAQLAHEGLVSPRNHGVVLDLMYRGLIVRDPALRLMNDSFGLFIRQTAGHTKLLEWEAEEATSLWSILRWLLPVPLLLLGAFLFVTQRDAVSSAVGFVLAAASVAPTLVNLFGYFEQRFARGTAEKEAKAGA